MYPEILVKKKNVKRKEKFDAFTTERKSNYSTGRREEEKGSSSKKKMASKKRKKIFHLLARKPIEHGGWKSGGAEWMELNKHGYDVYTQEQTEISAPFWNSICVIQEVLYIREKQLQVIGDTGFFFFFFVFLPRDTY